MTTVQNITRSEYEPLEINGRGKKNLETEKKRLFRAAKDMESLFLYQLLKSMRKTIPKSSLGENSPMNDGHGKDIYTQMFDQELASLMSGRGDRSIAAALFRSMEKTLDAQYGQESGEKTDLESLMPPRKYIKIGKPANPQGRSLDRVKTTTAKTQTGKFDRVIDRIARRYRLAPELIKAVIAVESGGDSRAVSSVGAKGLMQLTDTTATEMGVSDAFWPAENINGGAKYLRRMIDRFGNIKLALAAYNAGPGTVESYGGVPPYPETTEYVARVMDRVGTVEPYY
jgi:Rod binding domain-containing protein